MILLFINHKMLINRNHKIQTCFNYEDNDTSKNGKVLKINTNIEYSNRCNGFHFSINLKEES